MSWPGDPRLRTVDALALKKAIEVDGVGTVEASKLFGCSKGTIGNRMREFGIQNPRRGNGILRKLKIQGMFRCPNCEHDFPIAEFGGWASKGGSPHYPYCGACKRQLHRNRINKTLKYRFYSIFNSARNRAAKHGLVFELECSDFDKLWEKQNGRCFYTSLEMITEESARRGRTVSLDRIDSAKGYVLDNVVLCCTAVNRMKMDMTVEEFKGWCQAVHQHGFRDHL